MHNTIAQMWEGYVATVMPEGASETQRVETRRAFYAGVATMFSKQQDLVDSGISEDAMCGIMNGWSDELRMFTGQLKAGKA